MKVRSVQGATTISSGSTRTLGSRGGLRCRMRPITRRSPSPVPRANTRSIRWTFIMSVVPMPNPTAPLVTMTMSPSLK